jgi:hypothetical protein
MHPIEGIIMALFGIWATVVGNGPAKGLTDNPNADTEKALPMMKVLGPVLIVCGVLLALSGLVRK